MTCPRDGDKCLMINVKQLTTSNQQLTTNKITMIQTASTSIETHQWVTVCNLSDIQPNTGVCALIGEAQVAIFRIGETDEVYAIGNYDPFSKAFVLSRGIIGDRKGILKVASPIYKQNFALKTGQCLDDDSVSVPSYSVRVVENSIQVSSV
jgi:nitrite reductase (NADH) small subunit